MKIRLLACAAVLSLTAAAVQAAPEVERREIGNQILENVPVAPASVREGLNRYQNVRAASFQDWTPDGGMLITTRFGNTAQLHKVAFPGGDRSQLTFHDEPVSGVHALPGTGGVLFSKDTGGDEWFQLFVRGADGQETQITQTGTRNASPAWSKDGSVLVWARSTKGSSDTDILMRDPSAPGGARVILRGEGAIAPQAVSPDGKTVLLGRYYSINESKRWLLDIASGKLTPLNPSPDKIAYAGGRFMPDGKSVIMLSDEGSDVMRIVLIDLATGAKQFSGDRVWDVEDFAVSDDGKMLAYVVNEDGYSKLYVRDHLTRRSLPQPPLPAGVVSGMSFSPDGQALGFSLATPTASGDAWSWRWDTPDGKLERWTTSELGGLDPNTLATPRLVRFASFDKRSIPAFVYKPKAAGAKLPVIIDIHGGPEGQSRPVFSPITQQMVGQLGAAVIVTNVRGSSGYGKAYLNLDNAEKREDSVKDIGALLDWIKTQPDLDPSRVVVYGQSYGGYMSLAVMTRYSDRMAGGIERYGISNFTSFLNNTETYRRDLRRAEYGDERDPRMAKVFEAISPLNNVGKIRKPMLVMQGSNDPRVPQSESDQVVAKLRQQGVETWYVLFKDEGHGFLKKVNNDRRREVETLFLRKVLGLQPAG